MRIPECTISPLARVSPPTISGQYALSVLTPEPESDWFVSDFSRVVSVASWRVSVQCGPATGTQDMQHCNMGGDIQ